jgi:hypothetical protein
MELSVPSASQLAHPEWVGPAAVEEALPTRASSPCAIAPWPKASPETVEDMDKEKALTLEAKAVMVAGSSILAP